MRIVALAIGAALAGAPLALPDASLEAPVPLLEVQKLPAEAPGPDVMRAIELPFSLCLSGRCVQV